MCDKKKENVKSWHKRSTREGTIMLQEIPATKVKNQKNVKHRRTEVIPVVVGALGSISKKLKKCIDELRINISKALLQKTTLLGTARIYIKEVLDCG